MRIAQVVGTVTLSRRHPTLTGAAWRVVVPLGRTALAGGSGGRGEPLVAYDEFGAGDGALVTISEGGEAAAPFHPQQVPVDAYVSALLDVVDVG